MSKSRITHITAGKNPLSFRYKLEFAMHRIVQPRSVKPGGAGCEAGTVRVLPERKRPNSFRI
jgi:hypothetical protein